MSSSPAATNTAQASTQGIAKPVPSTSASAPSATPKPVTASSATPKPVTASSATPNPATAPSATPKPAAASSSTAKPSTASSNNAKSTTASNANVPVPFIIKHDKLLKNIWEAGHLAVVALSVMFTLFFVLFSGGSLFGQLVYRSLFFSAVGVYLISLTKRFEGEVPSFYVLLRMESFQYGALAFFWIFTRWHYLKVLPFFYFSAMHTAEFMSSRLQPGSAIASHINKFLNVDGPKLLKFIAYVNTLLIVRLFLDVITFRPGSGISLLVYAFFFRIQVAYSADTSNAMVDIKNRIETFANGPKAPAKVKELWAQLKDVSDSQQTAALDPKTARERATKITELRQQELKDEKAAQEKFLQSKKF